MAQPIRHIEKLFEENGFAPVKRTKHGVLYSDGMTTLMGTHRSPGWRAIRSLEADIRRAIRKRPIKEREKTKMNPEETRRRILVPPPKTAHSEKPFNPALPSMALNRAEPGKRPMRYPLEERLRLEKRLVELYRLGISQREMQEKLHEEGFRSPVGREIVRASIATALLKMGLSRHDDARQRAKAKEARLKEIERDKKSAENLRAEMMNENSKTFSTGPVVFGPILHKEGMVSKELILSVLTDPSLADSKKIRLLMVYLD